MLVLTIDERLKFFYAIKKCSSSNFHCRIWIQHKKCFQMSSNKPSIGLAVSEVAFVTLKKNLVNFQLFCTLTIWRVFQSQEVNRLRDPIKRRLHNMYKEPMIHSLKWLIDYFGVKIENVERGRRSWFVSIIPRGRERQDDSLVSGCSRSEVGSFSHPAFFSLKLWNSDIDHWSIT